MIFFVDEDSSAFGAWILELELRQYDVRTIANADAAFNELAGADEHAVDLVVIDVMLAGADPIESRFSAARTDAYLETGLCLLEDLSAQNPTVFPRRGVLLTNTSNPTTLESARRTSFLFEIPLWNKATFASPADFGDPDRSPAKELAH